MTLGTLAAFMAYQARVVAPVQALMGLYGALATARVSWRRVAELLDTRAEVIERRTPSRSPTVRGEIEFDGVSLAHGRGGAVLDGVSFRAAPGADAGGRRARAAAASRPSPICSCGCSIRMPAPCGSTATTCARCGSTTSAGTCTSWIRSRCSSTRRSRRTSGTRTRTPTDADVAAAPSTAAGLARFVAGAARRRPHDGRRPRPGAVGRRAAADGARARVSGRPGRARARRAQRRARPVAEATDHRRLSRASCAAGRRS